MNNITYVGRHPLMLTVSRHAHSSWEFIYCTYGAGQLIFDNRTLGYTAGQVVVIPPMTPHSNESTDGFKNIHINMSAPTLTFREPLVIQDDNNHFLLDAFNAAFYHYHTERTERTALLSCYGNLICCYLMAYQTGPRRSPVVEQIEHHIISNFADCDYRVGDYLRTLPFSSDHLRKLFQKEMGVTPLQYLNDMRLQVAAEVLVNDSGTDSVADVALMCGFREPLYFSKMFKKKYGVAPSAYATSRQIDSADVALDSDSVKIPVEDA